MKIYTFNQYHPEDYKLGMPYGETITEHVTIDVDKITEMKTSQNEGGRKNAYYLEILLDNNQSRLYSFEDKLDLMSTYVAILKKMEGKE